MHILNIEEKEDQKNVTAFLVLRIIEYTALTLRIYNFWSVKFVFDNNNLKNIKKTLQT